MLKQFGQEMWTADGAHIDIAGFLYPTRMAIIRLSSGHLFIWSPVTLTEALKAAVDALGEVRHIAAPNSLHHLYLPEWKSAYPGASLYAAPGLRDRRNDIVFDADLGTEPHPDWAGEIDQVQVPGNLITTEVCSSTSGAAARSLPICCSSFLPARSPAGGRWWRNWTS